MASINDKGIDQSNLDQEKFPLHTTIPMVANNLTLQLKGKNMYVPCWAGSPGMGKTAHAKIIADMLDLHMLYFSMNKPYEAMTGLPAMNSLTFGDDSNRKNLYVFWSEPELVHLANELARKKDKKGCLIFLDDMHIMSPDVQKTFFEFILERKLGNYALDENCCILGAMNSSNMAGFDGFFSAINNRIQRINVNMEFDYWFNNVGADLNPLIATYVRYFKTDLEEPESTDTPFATYRSWCMVSDMVQMPYQTYLKNKDDVWFLNQIFMIACGYMSHKKAITLKDNIKNQLRYDFEGMVNNNKFYIDQKDPISQFCFGNVIRYLRDEKDAENLVKYIITIISKDDDINNYQNAILNIMYELVALTNALVKKTDEYSVKRLKMLRGLQSNIFRSGQTKIHRMFANITGYNYSNDKKDTPMIANVIE